MSNTVSEVFRLRNKAAGKNLWLTRIEIISSFNQILCYRYKSALRLRALAVKEQQSSS